jgi:hypothetical protein
MLAHYALAMYVGVLELLKWAENMHFVSVSVRSVCESVSSQDVVISATAGLFLGIYFMHIFARPKAVLPSTAADDYPIDTANDESNVLNNKPMSSYGAV